MLALLVSALLAAPGIAGAQTEAPVTVPNTVTGTAPLTVTVPSVGQGVTVTITDKAGAVASWTFAALEQADGGHVQVDLRAPDTGSAPVNGPATVTVTLGDAAVYEGTLVIDLSPATPALSAIAAGESVRLFWAAVAGPGPITYRLERSINSGAWSTLVESATTGHRDADVQPGRYRYRLTALVPAAGEGSNASAATTTVVRVSAARDAAADPDPEAKTPNVRKPSIPVLPPKPRKVSAAGERVTPVRADAEDAKRRGAAKRRARPPTVLRSTLTLGDLPRGVAGPRFAAPDDARPRPAAAPTVAAEPPALFPVNVPPAGTLAVDSAAAVSQRPDLMLLAAGLLLLLAAAEATVLVRGRRRVTPAPVDLP